MRVWVAVAVLFLASCADDGGERSADTLDIDDDRKATATTGVIRGVVVDSSVTPVPGVAVTLLQTGEATTSNDAGAFGFSDVAPGSHFPKFEMDGFESTQASVAVEAGDDKPPSCAC